MGCAKHDADSKPTTVLDRQSSPLSLLQLQIGLPPNSARASKRICDHFLKPLLEKCFLGDFYSIVKDCFTRILGKAMLYLLDVEKTLISIAHVNDLPK